MLYGPAYSTNARTAPLAFEEKGVPYVLHAVDTVSGEGQRPEHLARHPGGKVPVLDHDGFSVFETAAIARYIDEAFPGPALQPADARRRARMAQVCAVLDNYGWHPMVMRVFLQSVVVPMHGGAPDRAAVTEALPQAERALAVVEGLMDGGDFLCGKALSLADCHLVPNLDYFALTDDGRAALASRARLSAWGRRMERRPSVAGTRPSLG